MIAMRENSCSSLSLFIASGMIKIRRVFLFLFFCAFSFASVAEETDHSEGKIRVAVYGDKGTGKSREVLLEVLKKFPEFKVTEIKAADVTAGKLSEFDVVIHPGGSGGGQGRSLGEDGRENVRSFVSNGGGFVGICAGAYLASNDYSWSLNITDAKVLDRKHWARGTGKVQVELTAAGKKQLGYDKGEVTIYYGQGPLFAPKNDPDVPDYRLLGIYKTEVTKKGVPGGVMQGTAAIAANEFGKGRVFCFSPHPEKTRGLETFVQRAVTWAAGGK